MEACVIKCVMFAYHAVRTSTLKGESPSPVFAKKKSADAPVCSSLHPPFYPPHSMLSCARDTHRHDRTLFFARALHPTTPTITTLNSGGTGGEGQPQHRTDPFFANTGMHIDRRVDLPTDGAYLFQGGDEGTTSTAANGLVVTLTPAATMHDADEHRGGWQIPTAAVLKTDAVDSR